MPLELGQVDPWSCTSHTLVSGGCPLLHPSVTGGCPLLHPRVTGGCPLLHPSVTGGCPLLHPRVTGGCSLLHPSVTGDCSLLHPSVTDGCPQSHRLFSALARNNTVTPYLMVVRSCALCYWRLPGNSSKLCMRTNVHTAIANRITSN